MVRRVGWILTKYAGRDDLEGLRALARSGSPTPSLLDPAGPKTGAVNADWNLRLNREVEPDLHGSPFETRREQVEAEATRLVYLGATRLHTIVQEGLDHNAVGLIDPEANEFDAN